ncbi:MAG TPA: T9SS type A sorting domain-containing protein [Chitinophagales bacterium]|nr:T9SS type A sorting domain-containing protein [Chitinophagales bacterium]
MRKLSLLVFILDSLLLVTNSCAQTTFQKIFTSALDAYCFGAYQTTDQGYIITGIANTSGTTQKVFLTRTDCHGEILWNKVYSTSSTIGNISQRVIETHDQGFLLAASSGSYGAYNIMLVRTNGAGVTLWKKTMNGPYDDLANSVIETPHHDYVIVGSTNSYGSDAGTPYKDVYMMKIDDNGNFLWGKTYGNPQTYDEAYDIVSTGNGYALTGRYIASGAFHCLLMKTDTAGNLQWIKCFGDTNQYASGYAIANTFDGGFIITGSSTLNKSSFQDFGDAFIIRSNGSGDTLWSKNYYGDNPDYDDIGSSIIVNPDNTFAIANATMSYPTTGYVPNKHCVMVVDDDGSLVLAKIYENGGSHYPYLSSGKSDRTFVLSGFSNYFTSHFNVMLMRLDSDYSAGCNTTDVTNHTVTEHLRAKVKTPSYAVGSGGNLISATSESDYTLGDSALCFHSSDTCYVFFSVNDLLNENAAVFIFPNPASDQLAVRISSQSNQMIVLQLFNSLGEAVQKKIVDAHNGENYFFITTSEFTEGSYLLFASGNEFYETGKVIIQH